MNEKKVHPKKLAIISILVMCVLGVLVFLYVTSQGIGTSPDSVAYIGAATNLISGKGLSIPYGNQSESSLTWFPPLYPMVLAWVGLSGLDILQAARAVQLILYSGLIFFVGTLFRKNLPSSSLAVLLGGFILLTSIPILSIYSMAWSEALFVFFALLSFFVLSCFLDQPRFIILIIATLLAGLSFVTRYAGIAVVISGFMGILLFSRKTAKLRVLDAGIFGIIGIMPGFLWIVSQTKAGDSIAGRQLGWHPFGKPQLFQLLDSISSWFLIPGSIHWFVRGSIIMFFLGLLLGWFLYHVRNSQQGMRNLREIPNFLKLLAVFIPVYLIFLVFSISFVDANTPLNNRILIPIYISGLLLCFYIIAVMLGSTSSRFARYSFITVILSLSILVMWYGFIWIRSVHSMGLGFTSLRWRNSEVLAELQEIPNDLVLYSNAPEPIYLHTARSAIRLPRNFLKASQQPNPDFESEFNKMNEDLKQCNAVMLYFTKMEHSSLQEKEDLSRSLNLSEIRSADDGVILAFQGTDKDCLLIP